MPHEGSPIWNTDPELTKEAQRLEHPTEDDLAIEFTNRHAHELRYVALWGSWLQWNGAIWLKERTLRAFDLARTVARETLGAPRRAKTVAAIEQLARSDRKHAMTHEAWDRDTEWFNTPREDDGH